MITDYAGQSPCVFLEWDKYLDWLGGKLKITHDGDGGLVRLGPPWKPGEHKAMIGPTGEGKTTHAVGILDLRKWVLALDPKGNDDTLAASGYLRVSSIWKPGLQWKIMHREDARTWDHIWKAIEDDRPARVIVGGPADDDAQFTALKTLIGDGVKFCRYVGGFTQYCDEFEIASSREMMNIAPAINLALISARRKGISVVNSYQAQAWVSKHAIRQARRAVMWSTGDRDMIQSVARGMGRSWQDTAALIDQLPPFATATIPRGKNGGPMVITKAPKVA